MRDLTPMLGPCEGCGELTKRQTGKLRGNFYRCQACQIRALAIFLETPEPGETLAEMSAAEQTGAWLREMARKPSPERGQG